MQGRPISIKGDKGHVQLNDQLSTSLLYPSYISVVPFYTISL
jgi:hypothetical protein